MTAPPRSLCENPAFRVGLPLLLLAAVILAAFQQVFKSPLAFDDASSIAQVRHFTSWHQVWGLDAISYFRPVKNLYFYLVEQTGGGVTRYHWVNLCAYYLAACSVFVLTLRLSGNALASFAAGVIWAISPTGGTNAVWASCFNINVATAAMAFCVTAYDCMRDDSGRRPVLLGLVATFFLILGLLSYETAIATAPLLVLVDAYRGRKIFSSRSISIYSVIALIVVAWLACRQSFTVSVVPMDNPSLPPGMPRWQLAASAPYFLWTHLVMWIAPGGRLETFGSYMWDRSVPAAILPFCWLILAGSIYLAVRFWKRAPLLMFGAAWFFIAAFPSGNFVPFKNTPYADYYVPIPSIGLCIMLAAVLRAAILRLREPGAERSSIAVALATILGIAGWRLAQLPVLADWLSAWEVPARVMVRTAVARPHQFLAKAVMAYTIAFNGDEQTPETLELIESAARDAEQDMPDLGIIQSALGKAARARGQNEQAIAYYEKSLRLRHISYETFIWTRYELAAALIEEPRNWPAAQSHLTILLHERSSASHPKFVLLAAELMHKAGNSQQEIKTLEKGHLYHPDNAEILTALEKARARTSSSS